MDQNTNFATGKTAFSAPSNNLNAMKRESEISLTPSEVSRHGKLNSFKKNPLDAITRAPKLNELHEKRSGLQNVVEENLKDCCSSPFSQKNSGLSPPGLRAYANNSGQNVNKPDNSATLQTPEPTPEDMANAHNVSKQDEQGFCATCPNCSTRILLMPESETKFEDNNSGQKP